MNSIQSIAGSKGHSNSMPVQRNAANARERARMRVLSSAFCRLKTKLPWVPADTKLSKLDTLRLATIYIQQLRSSLATGQDLYYTNDISRFDANSAIGTNQPSLVSVHVQLHNFKVKRKFPRKKRCMNIENSFFSKNLFKKSDDSIFEWPEILKSRIVLFKKKDRRFVMAFHKLKPNMNHLLK